MHFAFVIGITVAVVYVIRTFHGLHTENPIDL
jgi:hypothetical protein